MLQQEVGVTLLRHDAICRAGRNQYFLALPGPSPVFVGFPDPRCPKSAGVQARARSGSERCSAAPCMVVGGRGQAFPGQDEGSRAHSALTGSGFLAAGAAGSGAGARCSPRASPSSVFSRMFRMSASSSVSSSGCWATYGCTHWTCGQSAGGGRAWCIPSTRSPALPCPTLGQAWDTRDPLEASQ